MVCRTVAAVLLSLLLPLLSIVAVAAADHGLRARPATTSAAVSVKQPVQRAEAVASWTDVFAIASWEPRYGASAATLQPPYANETTLLLAGGGGAQYFSDVWTYGAGDATFRDTQPQPKPWRARINFVMLFFKDQLFLMGGLLNNGTYANDVWASPYSLSGENPWNFGGLASWQGREGHKGVVHVVNDVAYIFVMGGRTSGQTFLNDVYKWTADGSGEWSLVAEPAAWPARWAFGLTSYANKLWVAGGQGQAVGNTVFNDVWSSTGGQHWTQASTALPSPRWGLDMVQLLGFMFIVGGSTNNSYTVLYANSDAVWKPMPAPHRVAYRTFQATTVYDKGIAVLAGETPATHPQYLEDFWLWQPCATVNDCAKYNGRAQCQLQADLKATCVCLTPYTGNNCTKLAPLHPSKPPPGNNDDWVVVGCLCAFAAVLLSCIVVLARRRRILAQAELVSKSLTDDWLIPARKLKIDPQPIAAGGFAQVFRARYKGSLVAVKQIHGYLMATKDREQLYMQRFRSEAIMMAKLHHPNIQGLLGVCLEPQLCLVTEFAPFGSLADILDNVESLQGLHEDEIIKVAFQIAAGMQFLHSRSPKITHRDLNTNNVLVYSLEYAELNVRIADFGLSREMVKDVSMTGYLGSPSYIAPEILTDSAVYDETVDVYSYGIILWTLVKFLSIGNLDVQPSKQQHRAMMTPYPEMSPWQIVARVKEGMRPVVPRSNPSPILEGLMSECWAHRPSERPPFTHVLDVLEEHDVRLRRPHGLGDIFREPSLMPQRQATFISCVMDKLYVGGLGGVRDSGSLRRHHITHVLNVAGKVAGVALSRSTRVKIVKLEDDPQFSLLPHLAELIVFIEKARREGSVFVHCLAGKSRSVAVVAAYLMIVYNLSSDEALDFVHLRHPPSEPNPGFIDQLEQLDEPSNTTRIQCLQALQRATNGAAPLPFNTTAVRKNGNRRVSQRRRARHQFSSPQVRRSRFRRSSSVERTSRQHRTSSAGVTSEASDGALLIRSYERSPSRARRSKKGKGGKSKGHKGSSKGSKGSKRKSGKPRRSRSHVGSGSGPTLARGRSNRSSGNESSGRSLRRQRSPPAATSSTPLLAASSAPTPDGYSVGVGRSAGAPRTPPRVAGHGLQYVPVSVPSAAGLPRVTPKVKASTRKSKRSKKKSSSATTHGSGAGASAAAAPATAAIAPRVVPRVSSTTAPPPMELPMSATATSDTSGVTATTTSAPAPTVRTNSHTKSRRKGKSSSRLHRSSGSNTTSTSTSSLRLHHSAKSAGRGTAETVVCSNCSTVCSASQRFCMNCGHRLQS